MKKILLVVMMVFLVQSGAYAEEGEGKGEKLEKMKGKILENLNKRRGLLDELEDCVKSASSREDMKSCRKANKEKMEALRGERKEMKNKRKEKRGNRE